MASYFLLCLSLPFSLSLPRDSDLATLFAKEFASSSSTEADDSASLTETPDDTLSLSQVLFHFSAPVTLSEMRELYRDEVKQ